MSSTFLVYVFIKILFLPNIYQMKFNLKNINSLKIRQLYNEQYLHFIG
jgi:hypothetical protein